jgi:hypothetical protein
MRLDELPGYDCGTNDLGSTSHLEIVHTITTWWGCLIGSKTWPQNHRAQIFETPGLRKGDSSHKKVFIVSLEVGQLFILTSFITNSQTSNKHAEGASA